MCNYTGLLYTCWSILRCLQVIVVTVYNGSILMWLMLCLSVVSRIAVGGITEDELEREFSALDINTGTHSVLKLCIHS